MDYHQGRKENEKRILLGITLWLNELNANDSHIIIGNRRIIKGVQVVSELFEILLDCQNNLND